MNDHKKFNKLLSQLGDRKSLADYIGIKESSLTNQLAPGNKKPKELPKWAKSMLYVQERWQNKNGDNADQPAKGKDVA